MLLSSNSDVGVSERDREGQRERERTVGHRNQEKHGNSTSIVPTFSCQEEASISQYNFEGEES